MRSVELTKSTSKSEVVGKPYPENGDSSPTPMRENHYAVSLD